MDVSQTKLTWKVDLMNDNKPAWESMHFLLLQVIVTLKETKLEKL